MWLNDSKLFCNNCSCYGRINLTLLVSCISAPTPWTVKSAIVIGWVPVKETLVSLAVLLLNKSDFQFAINKNIIKYMKAKQKII